jgi:hypothetical protein
MFSLADMVEKVKDLAAPAGERLWELIPGAVREKLPWFEERPLLLLIGPALALFVLLAVLIGALASPGAVLTADNGGGVSSRDLEAMGFFRDAAIPPEELFLPDEPDFLPGVIPEREQREVWSAEDAAPYWYDPLEGAGDEWRGRIKTALDELLEYVP